MITYQGKPINQYFTSQLTSILAYFKNLEDKRIEASKHIKFSKMEFPPPNPEFVAIKLAIEEELELRKTEVNDFEKVTPNA